MKHTAVFDLDGTVLDTLDDLTDAVNHALRTCGMPERRRDEIRAFLGNGIPNLISRVVPAETGDEDRTRVHEIFSAYYRAHCADKTRPYDGIPGLMKRLKQDGWKIAVVSNKDDDAVARLCETYFPGLTDASVGRRDGIPKKPAPDQVYEAMRRMNADRSDAVFLGDSDVDVATAKNAGLPCVAVLWGFRDEDFLRAHGATVLAHDPDEAEAILRRM